MKKLWSIAFFSWGLALLVGLTVFVAFWFTQANWLVLPGIFVFEGGIILSVIGVICLTIYAFKKSKIKRGKRQVLGLYFLLLTNIPLAIFLFLASYGIAGISVVRIINNSERIIDDITVQAGSIHHIVNFPPRADKINKIYIKGEGQVDYSVTMAGKTQSGVLFGYITSGVSQSAKITVDKYLNISAEETTDWNIGQAAGR